MQTRALALVLGALLLFAGGLFLMFGGRSAQPVTPPLLALAGPDAEPPPELDFEPDRRALDAPEGGAIRAPKSSRRSAPVVGCGLALEVQLVGKPAAGAQVFGRARGKALQSLGSTDLMGQLQLRLDPGSWSLSVKIPGAAFASRVIWLTKGEQHKLRMDLPTPAAIEGIVRDAEGLPVRGSAVVWAWDSEEPDPLSLLRRDRGKPLEPRLFQSRTNARGFFRLTGLDPARSYRLAALGPSSMSVQGQVQKAGQKADLRLSPVVAAVVQFAATGKASLPSASLGVLNLPPLVALAPGAVRLELAAYPELWLTPIGALLRRLPQRAGLFGSLVVAAVPPPAQKGGDSPASVQLEFPGFLPLKLDLDLAPITNAVSVISAQLQAASGPAAGSMRLDLSFQAKVAAALQADPRPLGELWLRSQMGHVLTVQLPARAQLPMTLAGIPAGTWSLSFHSRDGALNLTDPGQARGVVKIKPGRQASVDLDLADLAAVSLDLKMDADGLLGGDWADSVVLSYGRDQGAGRFCSLPRAPYLVLGLAPGPFVFRVLRLRGNQARGESGPVEIRAGELAQGTIPLVLPQRR